MEESLVFVVLAYALYRLGKLDCIQRIAGAIGFFCGAIVEARTLDLAITARTTTEWALAGFLLTGYLFQREIKHLFR